MASALMAVKVCTVIIGGHIGGGGGVVIVVSGGGCQTMIVFLS
jgi:hypothetical protein